ncbi:sigma factor-like helix-turn-helix DNA-binding protein [Paenibacillus zanthoxyli]|uniref:sigma factor-like helix-turn-helix DNA-binding protein n=1 Tax=Paenibacillus zanthoxyli TaxID=369399 RepID=UPI0009FED219|nr:sigma factor-like helix-turn-helix DNA-binding protein [Paenibacillus zanthoxyli]
MDNQISAYERYRKVIYRIGWRVQYKYKKIRTREFPLYNNQSDNGNFTILTENKILVQELLNSLPSQGRNIIYKLYILDMTEKDVARELQISQQGVSKWKRKMIQLLSQTLNS